MAPEFTPEQRAAIERRDASLLVRAGAGTGKTSVLVERFVEAVREDDVEVERILAITFTEKAAAEMKERVRDAAGRARDARRGPRRRGSLDLHHPPASAPACCAPTRSAPGSTPSTAFWTSSSPSAWASTPSTARSTTSCARPPATTWSRWPPTRPTACATWCAPRSPGNAAAGSATRAWSCRPSRRTGRPKPHAWRPRRWPRPRTSSRPPAGRWSTAPSRSWSAAGTRPPPARCPSWARWAAWSSSRAGSRRCSRARAPSTWRRSPPTAASSWPATSAAPRSCSRRWWRATAPTSSASSASAPAWTSRTSS